MLFSRREVGQWGESMTVVRIAKRFWIGRI